MTFVIEPTDQKFESDQWPLEWERNVCNVFVAILAILWNSRRFVLKRYFYTTLVWKHNLEPDSAIYLIYIISQREKLPNTRFLHVQD